LRKGLGEGGRGQAGSQSSHRVGRVIVAVQIAITLVLVVGAGLLARSLMKVLEVDPGFRVDRIVTMDVSLPWMEDPKAKASQAIFFSNLIGRRIFDQRDGADSPHVAVISESLAHDRWPNQDPIGHTIEFGNMDGDLRLLTIVGIVGDVHEYGLDAPPRPTVYVNLFQRPRAAITVTMLSDADTRLITSAARGIRQGLNPEGPARFRTFSQVYSASLGSRRFNVILIGLFGMVALLLA